MIKYAYSFLEDEFPHIAHKSKDAEELITLNKNNIAIKEM